MMLAIHTSDHDSLKSKYYFKKCIELNPQMVEGYYGMGTTFQYSG